MGETATQVGGLYQCDQRYWHVVGYTGIFLAQYL